MEVHRGIKIINNKKGYNYEHTYLERRNEGTISSFF